MFGDFEVKENVFDQYLGKVLCGGGKEWSACVTAHKKELVESKEQHWRVLPIVSGTWFEDYKQAANICVTYPQTKRYNKWVYQHLSG